MVASLADAASRRLDRANERATKRSNCLFGIGWNWLEYYFESAARSQAAIHFATSLSGPNNAQQCAIVMASREMRNRSSVAPDVAPAPLAKSKT